ncbi:MAG: hypothetical protein ACLQU4_20695 [Limisphaerales bacterium]
MLSELKRELDARSKKSIEGVIEWFATAERLGSSISERTARRCCKRLGYWLPLSDEREKGDHRRYRWTEAQLAEIRECAPQLCPERTLALHEIGTQMVTIRTVSDKWGVPYHRLRMDADYLSQGKLKRALSHAPEGPILEIRGVKDSFFKWCDDEFKLTGKTPSAAEAKKALESEFGIKMPLRTVYTHVAAWKKERPIRSRRYVKSGKYGKRAKILQQVMTPLQILGTSRGPAH